MEHNKKIELVEKYQLNQERYHNNVNILWQEIGHIILSGFYKKWIKWSFYSSNLLWEDSKQDLQIGFMLAMSAYDFKGTYELGKWLYMRSLSHASSEILKQFNNKNAIMNNYVNFDKNAEMVENLYFNTENLDTETSDAINAKNKLKIVNQCMIELRQNKKLKQKLEIFELRTSGKSGKEISELFGISMSEVKNSLFAIRKKIKSYILKKEPHFFKN